ncbi:MAG: serine/threonine protein kinase, partial [Myxococcales bacterium]|nr:serine/threonine protein kinase [Myxococcales bacterium]
MPMPKDMGPDETCPVVVPPTEAMSGGLGDGQIFAGRFRIERRMGRGGMGVVYAAYDEAVGERVAIKVLTHNFGPAVDRFRQEVRLARRVTHRNAARTFDLGEHELHRFITMELVEGESLHERLAREGRLPIDAALDIATQVCMGLHAAHEVGVVHRDLKPANIFIASNVVV